MSQRPSVPTSAVQPSQARVDSECSPPKGKATDAARPAPRCQKATSGAA